MATVERWQTGGRLSDAELRDLLNAVREQNNGDFSHTVGLQLYRAFHVCVDVVVFIAGLSGLVLIAATLLVHDWSLHWWDRDHSPPAHDPPKEQYKSRPKHRSDGLTDEPPLLLIFRSTEAQDLRRFAGPVSALRSRPREQTRRSRQVRGSVSRRVLAAYLDCDQHSCNYWLRTLGYRPALCGA